MLGTIKIRVERCQSSVLVVVGGVNLRDKYHVDNPSTIKHFVIWPNAAGAEKVV